MRTKPPQMLLYLTVPKYGGSQEIRIEFDDSQHNRDLMISRITDLLDEIDRAPAPEAP